MFREGEGDLFDLCDKFKTIEEKKKILLDITKQLYELHKRNIVHNDIKMENVIVENGKVILIDITSHNDKDVPAYTEGYLPPELLHKVYPYQFFRREITLFPSSSEVFHRLKINHY